MDISYTPGKANVMVDALSYKAYCSKLEVQVHQPLLYEELRKLNLKIVPQGYVNNLVLESSLDTLIKSRQPLDADIVKIKQDIAEGKPSSFTIDANDGDTMYFKGRLVVPMSPAIINCGLDFMEEAHNSPLSIHPGSTMMYKDLRQQYWWPYMKQDIARYVSQCDVCSRVKARQQKPAGWLQPLPPPDWKWDKVEMDFITGFPKSQKGNGAIFVVIDRFSKVAHFLPVKEKITASQLENLYISRIVSLHGIPLEITSDRGSLFTSRYWKSFMEAFGTRLSLSTAYHPQSQGQFERVNQVLEDMLRACVLSFGMKWEESLPFAEFSYKNSYQASLKMGPFEVLYRRKCQTHLNWSETGEQTLIGPDIIQRTEDQVRVIREHLKAAQSRQKSSYDRKHKEMVYQPGEYAYLRVTPMRGTHRFGIKGKLAPRYIGPFRILSRSGPVAYRLEL